MSLSAVVRRNQARNASCFHNQNPRLRSIDSLTMSKHSIRAPPWGFAAAKRLLSTPSPSIAEDSPAVAVALGEKKDGTPLYRRLSALGPALEGSVTRTMNKWVREGRAVRVDELIKYVKELRKYRRYRHALELMDWMVKTRGMNLSYTNRAICLDLICKVRGIKSAEEFFNSFPDPAKNERTYGALLNCYCSEKLADKATALYDKMKELNIASNTLVYNNLMSLYGKLGQPVKVFAVFQTMKARNIATDNLSYCILMNSYSSLGDIEAVEGVMKEMEEGNEVVIQWTAYSTLAAIYNSACLYSKAESALKKLEVLIDGRDREPFHFLISLYAGAGNLEEVRRVWKSLKATFPKQTNMSYFTLLHALNKFGDIEGMKQCFDEWKSIAVAYDLRIANLLVGAYLRKDKEGEAKEVLEMAKEKGLSPDLRTCELFMDYYLKNFKIDLATRWCEIAASKMENGWTLDREKINEFLKHFEVARDVEGLENFCGTLKKIGCLDSRAYETLIRTYVVAGKRQPSIRRRILEDNIELDPKMYKLLGKVCK